MALGCPQAAGNKQRPRRYACEAGANEGMARAGRCPGLMLRSFVMVPFYRL